MSADDRLMVFLTGYRVYLSAEVAPEVSAGIRRWLDSHEQVGEVNHWPAIAEALALEGPVWDGYGLWHTTVDDDPYVEFVEAGYDRYFTWHPAGYRPVHSSDLFSVTPRECSDLAEQACPDLPMVFRCDGEDWTAMRAAEKFIADQGWSVGPSDRSGRRGVIFGDCVISKWNNLTPIERAVCDAVLVGRGQRGDRVLSSPPEYPSDQKGQR